MTESELIIKLNADTKEERLDALRRLRKMLDDGEIETPERGEDTNNHVHTIYSFSSYSPAAAVYQAYKSGLVTVGIVDHDSVSGAEEFIEAGDILGITTTVGAEVRVSFADTKLNGRVLNNPDEDTIAYIALHGIPHNNIKTVNEFLGRIREKRNERNRAQIETLNEILKPYDIEIDFDKDVYPISQANQGGSITERHILYALTLKLIDKYGKGQALADFLENEMKIPLTQRARQNLLDTEFPYYEYDVLNVLKSELVPAFFIKSGEDSLPVKEVVDFARSQGIIPTYCYLGDVAESPTGDKKAQKFEDDCLDEVFESAKKLGFEAIAYMPSRNTEEQLKRVMAKCDEYGFLQISGEDINQPRQSFVCAKLREPQFAHLADSTWALVGHEQSAGENIDDGFYSEKTKSEFPDAKQRVEEFKNRGLKYRR